MTRLIISFSAFFIVMFSCIFSSFYVTRLVEPLQFDIENAVKNFEKNPIISLDIIEKTVEKWDSANDILGMIVRHNELDELDSTFIRTLEYAKNGNEESFALECTELLYRLDNLIEKESFSLKNLF